MKDTHPRFIILATIVLVAFELLHGSRASVGSLIVYGQKLVESRTAPELTSQPSDLHTCSHNAYDLNPELEKAVDIKSILPRLTMVHGLIPFLPPVQQLEIMNSTTLDSVPPNTATQFTPLLHMWREYCAVITQMNSYVEWAVQQGQDTEIERA